MERLQAGWLLGAALTGAASASLTTFLILGSGDGGREPVPADLQPSPTEPDLAARVDALADENARLRERLVLLELMPAPVPQRVPVDGFATREELAALREELRAAARPSPLEELVSEPEQLKEQVASALIDLRKQEQVEKVRSYQVKRAARLDDDVAKMTDWLELDDFQADRMREVLLAQYEREEEVRLMWEDGVDDETLGQHKQQAGEAFWADASEVLTPVQLDRFREGVGGGKQDG